MGFYEHSDVIQWGINLLEGYPPGYYPGCYDDAIQYDTGDAGNGHSFHGHYDAYDDHRFHSHFDTEYNQVENDEIIAQILQQGFQKLEIGEHSWHSQPEPHSQPTYNYWHNTSTMNCCSAGHHGGVHDVEPPYSCYNPYEIKGFASKQTEDDPFDDETGGTLSQIVPIPHVPKINGEIPSTDEATSDHQRLKDRLQLYDFVEHHVQGDGNCQFRALSDQLYKTPDHHQSVRQQVVNQLETYRQIYEEYVPMEYGEYVQKMSRNGEWGDHVTLQAAADFYCVRIFVMTSFKDTCCIEILPHFENPKGVIFLSFWAEVHYNSIYPQQI